MGPIHTTTGSRLIPEDIANLLIRWAGLSTRGQFVTQVTRRVLLVEGVDYPLASLHSLPSTLTSSFPVLLAPIHLLLLSLQLPPASPLFSVRVLACGDALLLVSLAVPRRTRFDYEVQPALTSLENEAMQTPT